MALFTRLAPAAAPETWTPQGTIVSQRFRALEGATVLVFTADADQGAPATPPPAWAASTARTATPPAT